MGKFDLGAILQQQQAAPAEGRNIEVITQEILEAKRAGGEAILTIGKGLIEAKAVLPEGKWLPYLAETVDFSPRTAQRLMRLAREWTDATALSHLGASKALALLALPESERGEFLSESHQVNGQEKNVIDMTSRELERAIKEREEALADKRQAEQARQKMEEDMKLSSQLLESAKQEAQAAAEKAAQLAQELETLKSAPIDVAIAEVDQEALDKARAEGEAAKAEEIAQLQAKLEKAQADKKKAEEKQKEAEASLADANAKLEKADERASGLEKQLKVSGSKNISTFSVYYEQAKETFNRLLGCLTKIGRSCPAEEHDKLADALLSLLAAMSQQVPAKLGEGGVGDDSSGH